MKTATFITARSTSTRLPNKCFADIEGVPMIQHLIRRVKKSQESDIFVFTTTTNPTDQQLVDIAKAEGIEYFCGDEDDVFQRWIDAAVAFDVDVYAVAEGDDVFVDPFYIDTTIRKLKEDPELDYIQCKGLPYGVWPRAMKTKSAIKLKNSIEDEDTEGASRFFYQKEGYKYEFLEAEAKHQGFEDWRLTLDYQEDLNLLRAIYKELYKDGEEFLIDELFAFLTQHPELDEHNRTHKEAYTAKLKAEFDITEDEVFGISTNA